MTDEKTSEGIVKRILLILPMKLYSRFLKSKTRQNARTDQEGLRACIKNSVDADEAE